MTGRAADGGQVHPPRCGQTGDNHGRHSPPVSYLAGCRADMLTGGVSIDHPTSYRYVNGADGARRQKEGMKCPVHQ